MCTVANPLNCVITMMSDPLKIPNGVLAVEREVHVLLKKAAVFNRSSCKVASSSKFLTYVASWKKNPMLARLQSPILFLVSDSIGFHFRSREESRWGIWGCLWEKAGMG